MKPSRVAVWVNIVLAVVYAGVAGWYFSQGRTGYGFLWVAYTVFIIGVALWSERNYRRSRRQWDEHLQRMRELRERWSTIGRDAIARIDARERGDSQ